MAIACTNNIVSQHSNDISAEIPGNEAINTLSRTYNIFQMLFPVKTRFNCDREANSVIYVFYSPSSYKFS